MTRHGTASSVSTIARAWAALLAVAILAGACGPTATPATPTTPASSSARPSTAATSTQTPVSSSPSPVPTIPVRPSDAAWARAIDQALAAHDAEFSVAVGIAGRIVYVHLGDERRVPASNEKLLTSMTALEVFGPDHRFATTASSGGALRDGTLRGDLWLVGSGDPQLGTDGIARLADQLAAAGIERIDGALIADVGPFTNEWWAPGWVPGLSRDFVNRAKALSFEGNEGSTPPELQALGALEVALEARGVEIEGDLVTGSPAPSGAEVLARVASRPLAELIAFQNQGSLNFHAEMLLKALGARAAPDERSTTAGAEVVERWVAARGLTAEVKDGSGLSHRNAIAAQDLVRLLLLARDEPWGDVFVDSLAEPGEGTMDGRLAGIPLLAKTGTLFETDVSTLAGYVTEDDGTSVAFAVMSEGLEKPTAAAIEDAIVRTLAGARIH